MWQTRLVLVAFLREVGLSMPLEEHGVLDGTRELVL